MKKTLFYLLIMTFGIVATLSPTTEMVVAQETTRELGKQFVESVELPASTSTWRPGAGGQNTIGIPRPLDESRKDTVRYWVFLPLDYEKNAEGDGSPLVLFLHGAGERGDNPEDIERVKLHGVPRLLERESFARTWPAVAISPQCHTGMAWSPAQLMLLLDHIEANYKIDKSRIYVTGLSMGGFGTWMCLQEAPQRFAAGVPICGGGSAEWAPKLKDVPIWAFHGSNDRVVPYSVWAQDLIEAIIKEGSTRLISTIYQGVEHDSWTQTYNNQLIFDWLFSQRRRD